MKKFVWLAILFFAPLVPAFAADKYLVVSGGRSGYDFDKSDYDNLTTTAPGTTLISSLNKAGNAFKLEAGYKVNPYLSVEGGYVDLGRSRYSAGLAGYGFFGSVSTHASGPTLAVLGTLPITGDVNVHGKVGLIAAKVRVSNTLFDKTDSSDRIKPYFGFGADWKFSTTSGLRVGFERFNKIGDQSFEGTRVLTGKKINVDLISIGIFSSF